MNRQRNTTIDFLRGLAALLMILIHATAFFLSDPVARFVWDYTHIAVPLFVFCSAYIYFQRGSHNLNVGIIVKRIKRLIIPYYVYLIILFGALFIIDSSSLSAVGIIKKFLLFQGRDLNWLVVLFIYFIFLIPLIIKVSKHLSLSWFLMRVVWLMPIALLFVPPISSFRYVMWAPWSAFLIFVYWFVKYEKTSWFPIYIIALSLIGFFASRYVLVGIENTLIFTENKYPPNIYYLSYGIFWTTLLYELHRQLDRMGAIPGVVRRGFNFMSTHSYSLFFIHFWYVTIIRKMFDYGQLQWWGFFGVVLTLSIATQVIINKISPIVKGATPIFGVAPKK